LKKTGVIGFYNKLKFLLQTYVKINATITIVRDAEMEITVLGGGSEIGASCLHIQMDETSLIIDAGMRMHGENVLPMLGLLEDLSKPDAILVTHAHADHIGALPVLHALYPDVIVYATPPTADLMQIMMKDSFKILTEQSCLMESLMPYTAEQMATFLQHINRLPANGMLNIGGLKVMAYRAGHIVGAVMFLIESADESLLVTGDISFSGARTIPGAKVPQHIKPDVVVMESTYGNRLHTDRHTEEKRLAENVAATIEAGGFALVPAFALGRAQEVLLILQDYMDRGLIASFPIYVDGLVTPISQIYRSYPHYLKGPVAHRIRKNGDAFLTAGRCIAVKPEDRKEIVNGKPACIVASSGMLTGGASAWYAQQLVTDKKNAVFITGYQDEESPGRKLLALADGTESTMDINGTSYQVNCRVDKFGLSAHADANEMTRFIETLDPTYTLLVHGDEEARTSLATQIHPRFNPILVENGETYPFEKRKAGKGVVGKRYQVNREQDLLRKKIGSVLLYKKEGTETLKFGLCQNVHPKTATFLCETPKGKMDRVDAAAVVETLGSWNLAIEDFKETAEKVLTFSRPYLVGIHWERVSGPIYALQEIIRLLKLTDEAQQFAVALALQSIPDTCRHMDAAGTVGYKLDKSIRTNLQKLELPIQAIKMDPNNAMDVVRNYFSGHPRFLKCGVQQLGTANEHMLLSFDFPGGVSMEEREQIASDLLERTGWLVVVSESVRQEAFQTLLHDLIGSSVEMPSVHLHELLVVIKESDPDNKEEIARQFKTKTGFTLQFTANETDGQPQVPGTTVYQPEQGTVPMENNQAIATAKSLVADNHVTVYKIGMKQINGKPVMELHFISPEVARYYTDVMQDLSNRIGMDVQYAQHPKQNEIIRITKEMIPAAWQMSKNPSLNMEKGEVSVKIAADPGKEAWEEIAAEIEKHTGYVLLVRG
jgi:Cft2 family RNA processing exonuclease